MIAQFKTFWGERSQRERVLLSVMFAISATMFLWFGVAKPLMAARERADLRLATATDEAGLIAGRRSGAPGTGYRGATPAADVIRASGSAAGFTVTRADPDGAGGVSLTVASARAPALFAWLSGLERQGLRVATLNLRGNPDGSLAADATLRGGR